MTAELRACEPTDEAWIADVLEGWEGCNRWNLRGRSPSPLVVREILPSVVPLARVAQIAPARPVAVFAVDGVDEYNGYAQLGILADPAERVTVRAALEQFIRLAFAELGLRKLCLASAVDALPVERYVHDEGLQLAGRLADAEWRGPGRYVEVLAYELWRQP